jgi:transglutaminase-like putative cysteine protease
MEITRTEQHLRCVQQVCRRVGLGLLLGLGVLVGATRAADASSLQKLPLGERWYTIRMQDELVGFVRIVINPDKDGYEIVTESGAKMVVLGFTREAMSRERYLVAPDFALKSFAVEQTIDRAPLNFSGTVTAKGIKATITTGGTSKEQFITVKGKVYPPALVNLYPLQKGAVAGKKYKMQMLDPEGVKIKFVAITAIGQEVVAGANAYHFRNDLYPFVDNDIWVDSEGNTLRESVRHGLIETVAEPAAQVRQTLLTAAVAKKDLVLDFSLIRLEKPLERPQQLSRLVVELEGYPKDVPLLNGPGQLAERLPLERVRFIREQTSNGESVSAAALTELLKPTMRIPADNPAIIHQLKEALGGENDPRRMIEKLVPWVADYVKDTVTDGQTALDTLQSRTGNCVSHARLFVALARAAGLPSRMAVGLVYAPGKGLLYHAWAEVHVNGAWLTVDPTFNQVPADLTHLKLASGENPDDFAALAGLVGNLKAYVIETSYGDKR